MARPRRGERRTARSYRAKIFRNGGSQAIRLPKECQVEGSEVFVRREGDELIVSPAPQDEWGEEFAELFFKGRKDVTLPSREQPSQRRRAALK